MTEPDTDKVVSPRGEPTRPLIETPGRLTVEERLKELAAHSRFTVLKGSGAGTVIGGARRSSKRPKTF